jgi:hypothetical protein
MKTKRDYSQRSPEEIVWFEKNTWCDNCNEADIGMRDVIEYDENGLIYVEGKCIKCNQVVRSEIKS